MKIINLFGAPSAGKSTAMLGLTYKMKIMGLSAENTPEFFKEMIFEDSRTENFGGQLYVLGEQNRRIARLNNKNDFAVTDCPLPLIGFYTKTDYIKGFNEFVTNLFNSYDNFNYLIIRNHEFENEKRVHSEEQSISIEKELPLYLERLGIKYKLILSGDDLVDRLMLDLRESNIIKKEHLINSRNLKIKEIYKNL